MELVSGLIGAVADLISSFAAFAGFLFALCAAHLADEAGEKADKAIKKTDYLASRICDVDEGGDVRGDGERRG